MSLPWKVDGRKIRTVNGNHIVAETWETGQKNSAAIAEYDAAFIVKACNAYDSLFVNLAEERERVNWLDRDDITVDCTMRMDKPIVLIFNAKTGRLIGEGETLRAAIDAARQAASQPTGKSE